MSKITKNQQRTAAQAARKVLPNNLRREYNKAICQRIMGHPAILDAKMVLSYMAFAGEVDLAQLHDLFEDQGKQVCFPRCCEEGVIQALLPRDKKSWKEGRYGIQTPVAKHSEVIDAESIDVVLTPCVAFDTNRLRIGWGGGYYDRYLPRCLNAVSIGAAYEVQRVELVVSDHPWDAVLDAVATELDWY